MSLPAGDIRNPAACLGKRRSDTSQHADIELAKWLAIGAMIIDHFGKIVEPDLLEPTHAIGRVAFPVFATIIGIRLAVRPDLAVTYLKRLLPWAIVSQPVFVFVGRDWYDGNILLTLIAGVLVFMLVRQFGECRRALAPYGLALLLPFAWFCEFSVIGVAIIPITALFASWQRNAAVLAAGPLGVVANCSLAWPPLSLIDVSAVLATVIMAVSFRCAVELPRLPAYFFYGFYPAHLLAFHVIDVAF